MRGTYELKPLKRQFFFHFIETIQQPEHEHDLKGTECFLKNWNFSEDKFNIRIIRGFVILNYFSCKKI